MFVTNIGAYTDWLVDYIQKLGLDFSVYAGKPMAELQEKYAYFRLESNTPKISDDSTGTYIKEASFDFIFVGGNSSISDKEMYEMVDIFTQKFVTHQSGITLGNGFRIMNITEGSQSGVMRNEKNNPTLLAIFNIVYKSRYPEKLR